jgi:hypothetical protein
MLLDEQMFWSSALRISASKELNSRIDCRRHFSLLMPQALRKAPKREY